MLQALLGFPDYVSLGFPFDHRRELVAFEGRGFRPLAAEFGPEAVLISQTRRQLQPGGMTSHSQARGFAIRVCVGAVIIAVRFDNSRNIEIPKYLLKDIKLLSHGAILGTTLTTMAQNRRCATNSQR